MAKRRTRKDKESAHHQFLYSWQNEPKKVSAEANVKSQFKNVPEAKNSSAIPVIPVKRAKIMAQVYDLASIKRNILRSLIMASLILGIELVVYLAWNR